MRRTIMLVVMLALGLLALTLAPAARLCDPVAPARFAERSGRALRSEGTRTHGRAVARRSACSPAESMAYVFASAVAGSA